MTERQRLAWYGNDGVVDTYEHLLGSSYGVQTKKMEEKKALLKAKQVTDKKGKKKASTVNTPAEDDAIDLHDSSTSIPPPNQLAQQAQAQKRPRTASSELTRGSPQHKRGKKSTPPQLDQDSDKDTPLLGRSAKGKKVALSPLSSDNEMDMDEELDLLKEKEKSLSPED